LVGLVGYFALGGCTRAHISSGGSGGSGGSGKHVRIIFFLDKYILNILFFQFLFIIYNK
jgi:hypothetical protein